MAGWMPKRTEKEWREYLLALRKSDLLVVIRQEKLKPNGYAVQYDDVKTPKGHKNMVELVLTHFAYNNMVKRQKSL